MLIVRFLLASHPTPLYGRVRRETPQILEVLSGDPLRGPVEPTGQTLPYEPDVWQAAGERSPVLLLPPVVPSKIVAIGSNYRNHAKEMGKPVPDEPILFMKPPSALLPPGGAIVRPPGYERVDYEGELAVVVGQRMHRTPPEAVAAETVAGAAFECPQHRSLFAGFGQHQDGKVDAAVGNGIENCLDRQPRHAVGADQRIPAQVRQRFGDFLPPLDTGDFRFAHGSPEQTLQTRGAALVGVYEQQPQRGILGGFGNGHRCAGRRSFGLPKCSPRGWRRRRGL